MKLTESMVPLPETAALFEAAGSVEKFSWYRALQLLWNLQLLGLHPERTSYNMVCSSCERDERPGQLGVRNRFGLPIACQRNR